MAKPSGRGSYLFESVDLPKVKRRARSGIIR